MAGRSARVALIVALALLVAACASTPAATQPTPAPTREPNTISVTVLLDLSGSRAPSGQPQRNAMQLWLDQQTPVAGIRLKVKFVDVASSDARVLLELRRAAVEDRADAVVIGVPVTLDETFTAAAQVAAIPLLLTLPAPEPAATIGGRWIFVLAPTPDQLARALVTDVQTRGLLAPMLVASDGTSSGIGESGAFLAELARRQLMQPSVLDVTQTDGVARMRAAIAVARSAIFTGPAASYAAFIRGLPSTTTARTYLSYLSETSDLTSVRDQSALFTWPGSRWLATITNPPVPSARAVFVQSFTERHGAPSTLAGSAYDALGILQTAAALAPNELDPPRLRLRLDTLTFGGVVTTYAFTFTHHAGFTVDDLAYLRWNAQRGAAYVALDPKEEAR